MRIALRIVGTWLFAIAVILLVIDGTRSLAAGHLVVASLQSSWTQFSQQSLAAVRLFLASRYFGGVLVGVFDWLTGLPGFAVLGVPGLLLAYLGRSRRTRRYVRADAA